MYFILIILLLAFCIWFYIQRKKKMSILERHGIKGPKSNLIFGNMLELLSSGPNVKTINNWIQTYGRIFGYYMGAKPFVCVSDEELLKKILVQDFQHFADRDFGYHNHEPLTGSELKSSVAFVRGKTWVDQRAIINPRFSPSQIKMMLQSMTNSCTKFLEILENAKNLHDDVDMSKLYHGFSMDVISRCALGMQIDCMNTDHPFINQCHQINDKIGSGLLVYCSMIFPELEGLFYFLRCLNEYIQIMMGIFEYNHLKDTIYQLLKFRRESRIERNDLMQFMIDSTIRTQNTSDLTLVKKDLIGNKNKSYKFSDAELVGNAMFILVAGFDSTSSTLGYITHVLVNRPQLQEKIREELIKVIKQRGKLDYEGLLQLDLLENVIYETLRIFTLAPLIITRKANIDYYYDGITIPKGSGILVPIAHMHMDPEYWNEPDLFDETRFSDMSVKNRIIYQPFGLGPRVCLGSRFAIMEIKLILANILINYKIEPGNLTTIGEPNIYYSSSFARPKDVFVKITSLEHKIVLS